MLNPQLTNEQVNLLEQIDDFVEWIELSGRATLEDIDYLQGLINSFGNSIKERDEKQKLAEKCPWNEED